MPESTSPIASVAPALRPREAVLTHVVTTLEEDIVFGRLHARERLIEDDLIQRFQATRHIIRQALVELERLGIVERIPNRGSSVRWYSPETVEQLYMIRELVEQHAAQLIPLPLDEEQLSELEQIQALHDVAVDNNDLRMVFRSNIEFHRKLFGLCGNPFLAELIDDYAHRTHGIRFYSLVDRRNLLTSREEHRQMIDALRSGARADLIDLCRRHLLPAKELYLQLGRQTFG